MFVRQYTARRRREDVAAWRQVRRLPDSSGGLLWLAEVQKELADFMREIEAVEAVFIPEQAETEPEGEPAAE